MPISGIEEVSREVPLPKYLQIPFIKERWPNSNIQIDCMLVLNPLFIIRGVLKREFLSLLMQERKLKIVLIPLLFLTLILTLEIIYPQTHIIII